MVLLLQASNSLFSPSSAAGATSTAANSFRNPALNRGSPTTWSPRLIPSTGTRRLTHSLDLQSLPDGGTRRGPQLLTPSSAVAEDTSSIEPSSVDQGKKTKYYFVVANAKFMLDEEEHFKEQLFERLRYYGERNKEQDFWLAIEPEFLDRFPNITKRLKRPAVALVSTNGPWMTFMRLRLDRVLTESFEADSLEEALASSRLTTEMEFEKPKKWVAPYPKYESGWWEPFLPPGSQKPRV